MNSMLAAVRASVAFSLLMLLAPAPILAKTPGAVKDWHITPSSTEAVILIRVQSHQFDYDIRFSLEGHSGFLSRIYALRVPPFYSEKYIARSLKPGRYILTSIVQQGQWASCFVNGTKAITVQAGRVYYLGTLNADLLLTDLQESAFSRGKSSLPAGGLAMGWDHKVIPEWTIADDDEWEAVRAFVRLRMPMTTVPIERLEAETATLSVTRGGKIIQICG